MLALLDTSGACVHRRRFGNEVRRDIRTAGKIAKGSNVSPITRT